jgi:hypothetical protein
MALALLLALAILVFVLYTIVTRVLAPTETTLDPYAGISGTVATLQTSTTGSNTSTTGSGTATGAILARPDSTTASSSLEATTIANFRPANLLDGDLTSAWNEGADGPGLGEWVRFDFRESIPLARVEIANGYQKDEQRFAGNVRVKALELTYSDGSTQLVQLLDSEGLQTIQPSVDETAQITFTIISVYPRYEWQDAALSEIQVYERVGD